MTEATPPHGDPLRSEIERKDEDAERSPSDIPAPEPIDGPDRAGDEDPGAGAD